VNLGEDSYSVSGEAQRHGNDAAPLPHEIVNNLQERPGIMRLTHPERGDAEGQPWVPVSQIAKGVKPVPQEEEGKMKAPEVTGPFDIYLTGRRHETAQAFGHTRAYRPDGLFVWINADLKGLR
jgi:hypothetical protein